MINLVRNYFSRIRYFFGGAGSTLSEEYFGQGAPKRLRIILYGVSLFIVSLIVLGMYWSIEPDDSEIRSALNSPDVPIVGSATTKTLIEVVDILLDKPGGYLSNDILPPSVWLDNVPSWEYGCLLYTSPSPRDRQKSRMPSSA